MSYFECLSGHRHEHGYQQDLCDARLTDEERKAAQVRAAAPEMLEALRRAEKMLDALFSFYGQGLQVHGWHQNGDAEALDNFFDENSDGGELEALRAAIAKAEGRTA